MLARLNLFVSKNKSGDVFLVSSWLSIAEDLDLVLEAYIKCRCVFVPPRPSGRGFIIAEDRPHKTLRSGALLLGVVIYHISRRMHNETLVVLVYSKQILPRRRFC